MKKIVFIFCHTPKKSFFKGKLFEMNLVGLSATLWRKSPLIVRGGFDYRAGGDCGGFH